jgi:hypothetical protein
MLIPVIAFGSSFVFEVKPGYSVQSSNFGFQKGRVTPYVGLDIMAIGAEGNYVDSDYGEYYDPYLGTTTTFESEETIDISGSATLFIPHFGLKYHFADTDAGVRPYCIGGVFKSIAFVSVEGSEKTRYYQDGHLTRQNDGSVELEDKEKNALEDLLGVWGFNLGFGASYSLSESFSIGGEYGFRFFFASTSYDFEDSGDDYNSNGAPDWRQEFESELSGSLKLSYAAVVLSFKF